MHIQRFVNGTEISEPKLSGMEVSNDTLEAIFRSVCKRTEEMRPYRPAQTEGIPSSR